MSTEVLSAHKLSQASFVHLHVRSQYSLLQGALFVEDMVAKAAEFNMPAVALTDQNNLFGVIDFYLNCKDKKIKPIFGIDAHYHPQGYAAAMSAMTGSVSDKLKPKFYNLVLLCKNLKGYQNLCKMVTKAYEQVPEPVKGQPAPPKFIIDWNLLDQFGDDLIVLSGGLKSELSYYTLTSQTDEVTNIAKQFQKRFKENYYFQLEDTGLPESDEVNENLYSLSKKLKIEVVGTADCHYLNPEDGEAHEILQCIENGRNLDLTRPKSLVPYEYYFKSPELMIERLARFEGAVENTLKIAELCNCEFKFKDKDGKPIYLLPQFRPEGVSKSDPFNEIQFFRDESIKGLNKRFESHAFAEKRAQPNWTILKSEYEKRLSEELEMIIRMGFSGYFLIVSDFIRYAKNQRIPVGPGRGSGAGSLVAYALAITDIDPIEFNLLFERFINPERVSMPDFDIDFCQDRRAEVIEYVERKYGKENVCQIITFGKLQARAVLKDVGRVLGLSFQETDEINKLLPEELGITIDKAIQDEPRLRERMEQDPKVYQVVQYARKLEGLYRNAGIHAAGVIITDEPVVNYCPLYVGKDRDVVTQLDKDAAEKIGLIKYDFLGLKTLTVIDKAIQEIRKTAPLQLDAINLKDPKVFALVSSGDTDGVFQVESSGMKDLCARIQPGSIEDLTAINALYRPGPLGSGMVDDFIERKHGRKESVYEVEAMGPILKETYGVILYQEQVMNIARVLAGYSLGQADLLRRAMGKKKPEEMAKQKEIFVSGAIKNQLSKEKAEGIFDLMAKFAEYGFNKSHSAAYAMLTYQTAYLKTYYPAEFMSALMSTEINDTDKITKYISDAKSHGLRILPPDVNYSQRQFAVELVGDEKAIRFGLEAIKGVGGIAVDMILESRNEKGAYKDLVDFVKRVSTRKVNKKVMEALTISGSFDSISKVNRPSVLASIETLLQYAADEQAEKELGQNSLFDAFSADEVKLVTPLTNLIKNEPDFARSKQLQMEKQIVGFYVSGHPMDPWQKISEEWLGWNIEKLKNSAPASPPPQADKGSFGAGGFKRAKKPEVKIAGLISESKEITTKKGDLMAFGKLEDLTGSLEVVFFPEAYKACQALMKQSLNEVLPVMIVAEIEYAADGVKLFARSISDLEEVHKNRIEQVVLKIKVEKVSSDQLKELKKQILFFRGKYPVRIEFNHPDFKTRLELPEHVGVVTTPQMIESINKIFGYPVVHLQ